MIMTRMSREEFSSEIGDETYFLSMERIFNDFLADYDDKIADLTSENLRLKTMVQDLSNRPPHEVECPKCHENLEVHCSEETEYLKSHFIEIQK